MGTTPSVLNILDEIDLRLNLITTGNGYWFTAKKVTRAQLTPFKGYDLPAINYWTTTNFNTKDAYDTDERELRLFVEMHNLTRDDPFIDVAEKMAADVVTALNRRPADTAGWSKSQIGVPTDMTDFAATETKLKISADGDAAETVTFDWSAKTTGVLIAAEMQTKIRALGGNKATVTVSFGQERYVITSSSTGASSAIVITAGATLDCAARLRLGTANSGEEESGLVAAPAVSDDPSYDLGNTVKDVTFDGYDYEVGEGQEPWCGILCKFGIKFLADPFDMFTYMRE